LGRATYQSELLQKSRELKKRECFRSKGQKQGGQRYRELLRSKGEKGEKTRETFLLGRQTGGLNNRTSSRLTQREARRTKDCGQLGDGTVTRKEVIPGKTLRREKFQEGKRSPGKAARGGHKPTTAGTPQKTKGKGALCKQEGDLKGKNVVLKGNTKSQKN